MADNKTHPNAASVQDYLQSRASDSQRDDCKALIEVMQQLTGEPATMWGPSMVGFGRYRYTYASGHSGESFLLGFAIRGRDLVLYLAADYLTEADLPALLAPPDPTDKTRSKTPLKLSKACLYLKRLAELDLAALSAVLQGSMAELKRRYPQTPVS